MSNELQHSRFKSDRRQHRTRTQIRGTTDRPRLSVKISNRLISAQIIDDSQSKTLAYASSGTSGTLTERATSVGTEIAKLAAKAKVRKVVFDRGDAKYHGRVKNLADAARAAGLEF